MNVDKMRRLIGSLSQQIVDKYAGESGFSDVKTIEDLRYPRYNLCYRASKITQELLAKREIETRTEANLFLEEWKVFQKGKNGVNRPADHVFLVHPNPKREKSVVIDFTYLQFFPCDWKKESETYIPSTMVVELQDLIPFLSNIADRMRERHSSWADINNNRQELLNFYSAVWKVRR